MQHRVPDPVPDGIPHVPDPVSDGIPDAVPDGPDVEPDFVPDQAWMCRQTFLEWGGVAELLV